ncbi:DUF4276 family protein [Aeromonas hydrophila]|uniref:DUF4276 family protein n=1 Tax=Aeromonas hydrophila TaxID=644 RepID=UPI00207D333F|nr:DUF4276 family protein [Aeromonas hydrophila]MCO4214324.1 DUF4276 family protein [Aeromonas hydrophila]HDX8444990.1 hypothetical protein [Aeromonas hydrophila]HDX8634721.1 hypothetical protein [Aeromonas hydrophila]
MKKISIASEDIISETVLSKIVSEICAGEIVHRLGRTGCGDLTKNISKYNKLAMLHPVILMLDLDSRSCADAYVSSICAKIKKDPGLHIVVPVTEIESWLLSDKKTLSACLGVNEKIMPVEPDKLINPKQTIINLARKSKLREIKSGLPPATGEKCSIGISYNTVLCDYVNNYWRVNVAKEYSPSLQKTVDMLSVIV